MAIKKSNSKSSEFKSARSSGTDDTCWSESETESCSFCDERLRKRYRRLLSEVHSSIGGSIPYACQDWAATKAAYRFLSNPRVGEGGILAGHFEAGLLPKS